jgi:hypothetical protein
MFGPRPAGFWSDHHLSSKHQFLAAGLRYRVVKEFADFDRDRHPIGEEWVFLGCAFLPYEDGLSFFVSLDGTQEWHIRLQWRPEQQGGVLDALNEYLQPI